MESPKILHDAEAMELAVRDQPQPKAQPGGVHPAAIEIGLAAAIWFIAVTWISFAHGAEVDLDLVVVSLFFVMFFALFLLTASYAVKDPRWRLPKTSFRTFLNGEVGTATGPVSGREVLVEIALLPVALALAATAIGLVWIVTR